LATEHPDFTQVVQDPDFVDWVKSSPIRLGLYAKADGEFDYDSANELLSTYKQLKGVKTKQVSDAGEATRKQNLKAASVDTGGTGESIILSTSSIKSIHPLIPIISKRDS